jgi:hypothetical protein
MISTVEALLPLPLSVTGEVSNEHVVSDGRPEHIEGDNVIVPEKLLVVEKVIGVDPVPPGFATVIEAGLAATVNVAAPVTTSGVDAVEDE